MEEWKNELLNKYNLEEIVPDNVFIFKFNYFSKYTDSQMQVLASLGVHYQILSIQLVELTERLSANRMIIVVGKKQE